MITHSEFINKVKSKLPELEVLETFKTSNSKIIVKDNLNLKYKVRAYSLIQGIKPNIKSCLNKTEYFITHSKLIHKNKFDYNNTFYEGYFKKLIITCKKHGDFLQTPNSNLSGNGCKLCSIKPKKNNPGGFNYTNWIKLSNKSKYFESFKVYIIKCWDNKEEFYKIGKTYQKIEKRLGKGFTKRLPYNYEIVKIIKGDPLYICKLERELQRNNKHFKYLPIKNFNGKRECFSKINK